MPSYDYQGAIKAGANPSDVLNYMASQTGYDATSAIKAGANQNDVMSYMSNLPVKNTTSPSSNASDTSDNQNTGVNIPGGHFIDQMLNAPSSLINGLITSGASAVGKGLSAVGATGIGSKLQQGAANMAAEGTPGIFDSNEMMGQAPKNALDVGAKIAETGADVLAVTNPELGGWAIPGLFGASAGLESASQGEGAGTAALKGIGTGIITFFGGKLLGGLSELAGSGLSKILSGSTGRAISEAMGSYTEKIVSLLKSDPSVISNPNVVSEAQSTYDGLQKQLWNKVIDNGKIPDTDTAVQSQVILQANKELSKAFAQKDLTYADMFKRTDVQMPSSEADLAKTTQVFQNAKAQLEETATPEVEGLDMNKVTSGGKAIPAEPTGLWKQYLDAVSPILNDDGTPKVGVSLSDFLKSELRSKALNLPDPVQVSVDKTFTGYEKEAMAYVKANGTPEEKNIFNEFGARKDTAAYQEVQNVVKSKLTDAMNAYENPAVFFQDMADSLSKPGVTPAQIEKFQSMFGDNQKVLQDGFYNKILDILKSNVDKGAYGDNAKFLTNILNNSGDILTPSQKNVLEYGLKPLASQDFKAFLGNVGIGKTGAVAPEVISAVQDTASSQRISNILSDTLKSSDPDKLFGSFSKLTPQELETVRAKLPPEGQKQLDSFLKEKTAESTKIAIKNSTTGKFNLTGVQQFVEKLQNVKTGLSDQSQKELDSISSILNTKEDLANMSITRLGSILKGVRKLIISHVSGVGIGRYSAVTDISEGLTSSENIISPEKYVEAVKSILSNSKNITGQDLIRLSGIRQKGMTATMYASKLVDSLSPLIAGSVSKNVISPPDMTQGIPQKVTPSYTFDDYKGLAEKHLGRPLTPEETKALQAQYTANQ